jgi:cytochrome c-type biogenesis protein CcmH/NrfF
MRQILYGMVAAAIFLFGAADALEERNLTAAQMARYDRLTHELIAPCCWREPIAIHRSAEALQMLDEVEQFVVQGRSEDEIKSIYSTRYGPRILADPPGHDWYWLYLIPFGLLVSLMLAAVIRLRSLVARTPPASSAAPAELLAQVRAETENIW